MFSDVHCCFQCKYSKITKKNILFVLSIKFSKFQKVRESDFVHLFEGWNQKYSRLRSLLRVTGLVFCFYLGWSGSILHFKQNIIKVGSKSWLLPCISNITLSLPSYTDSTFCNGYLSLLYFWLEPNWKYLQKLPHLFSWELRKKFINF